MPKLKDVYTTTGFDYRFAPGNGGLKVKPIDVLVIDNQCFCVEKSGENNEHIFLWSINDEGIPGYRKVWLKNEDIKRAAKLILDHENQDITRDEEDSKKAAAERRATLDILKDIINGGKENAQIEKDR